MKILWPWSFRGRMNLTINSLVPSGLTLDRETQQVGWGNRKNGEGKDEVTGVNA